MKLDIAIVKILEYFGMEKEDIQIKNCGEIQKTMYLIQECGLNLGFTYSLSMITETYCDRLTECIHEIGYYSFESDKKLTEMAKNNLSKLKEFLDKSKPDSLDMTNWKKLLSTVHYLKYKESKTDDEVAEILLKRFNNTEEEIKRACKEANKIEENRKILRLLEYV